MLKLITVLALALSAFAQEKLDADLTDGARNGRFWSGLSSGAKIYFISGFIEGIYLSDSATEARYLAPHATIGEDLDSLDRFYLEPANARIAIRDALRIFTMKVKGATPGELEATVAALRKAIDALDRRKASK